jgi:hypothetical protein
MCQGRPQVSDCSGSFDTRDALFCSPTSKYHDRTQTKNATGSGERSLSIQCSWRLTSRAHQCGSDHSLLNDCYLKRVLETLRFQAASSAATTSAQNSTLCTLEGHCAHPDFNLKLNLKILCESARAHPEPAAKRPVTGPRRWQSPGG